jgi:hypothetical protein
MFTCTRCLSSTENDNDLCDACVKRIYETSEFGGSTIRTDQIPDEVVEAARKAFFSNKGMRGAIAAALNAWQGMEVRPTLNPSRIILFLPQEKQNDKT